MLRPTTRRGAAWAGLAGWAALVVGLRAVVLLPERCPPVGPADARQAAEAAVVWLDVNQRSDGRWLYRYRAADDTDLGGYNIVRHAGVLLSLYQAVGRGIEQAGPVAERGADWALANLTHADGWAALGSPDRTLEAGATALLVAALAERRVVTGDRSHDGTLEALGRFLTALLEPSGAVAQYWTPGQGPSVGSYSRFSTGETFWALARLHALLPSGGWREPAVRVGRYLATRRDRAEELFPAVADHWAAYGLDEVRRWPDGAMASAEVDPRGRYASRLGGLVGVQVRYESQRTDELPSRVTRGRRTLGAGLGTLGEAEGNLWSLAGRPRPAGQGKSAATGQFATAVEREVLGERARCVAGMLVARQMSVEEAAALPTPARAAGAWYQFGVTQMDDQQHALSALLLAEPILAGP